MLREVTIFFAVTTTNVKLLIADEPHYYVRLHRKGATVCKRKHRPSATVYLPFLLLPRFPFYFALFFSLSPQYSNFQGRL